MILAQPLSSPPARPRGPAIGWGISLLAHALLIAGLFALHPPGPAQGPAPTRITVTLVPQRPVAMPEPVTAAAPAAAPAPDASSARPLPRPRAVAPPRARAPAPIQVVPAPADDNGVAAPVPASPDAPHTAGQPAAPAFDMAAARATARMAARDGGSGNLVDRPKLAPTLDPGRTAREDPLSSGIERSRRGDCKSAYSGMGLFAVIPLVKDAVTGTGCKW